MADIVLRKGTQSGFTRVSNNFIDAYMTEANGEYVKIYLYLLRHLSGDGCGISIEGMAEALGHTQLDIRRALAYWQKKGILRLEYDEYDDLCAIDLFDEPVAVSEPVHEPVREAVHDASLTAPVVRQASESVSSITPMPQNIEYSPEELAVFRQNKDIRELLFVTEQYLGRTIGPTDINFVIYWYDELHMPMDLIEYLVEICVERGHSNIRYMNRVALNWMDEGITTKEKAKSAMSTRSESAYMVMKTFGISGRNLTPEELKYIKKWEQEYALPLPVIEEALKRTIMTISKPSFEYADSILRRWTEADVKGMEDIFRLDREHESRSRAGRTDQKPSASGNRFQNFEPREYDIDAIERLLLLNQN